MVVVYLQEEDAADVGVNQYPSPIETDGAENSIADIDVSGVTSHFDVNDPHVGFLRCFLVALQFRCSDELFRRVEDRPLPSDDTAHEALYERAQKLDQFAFRTAVLDPWRLQDPETKSLSATSSMASISSESSESTSSTPAMSPKAGAAREPKPPDPPALARPLRNLAPFFAEQVQKVARILSQLSGTFGASSRFIVPFVSSTFFAFFCRRSAQGSKRARQTHSRRGKLLANTSL